jgi:hypothetical protein
MLGRCVGCNNPFDHGNTEDAIYYPRPGGPAVKVPLCGPCNTLLRAGDRHMLELIELRVMLRST